NKFGRRVKQNLDVDPERVIACVEKLQSKLRWAYQFLIGFFWIGATLENCGFVRVPNRSPVRDAGAKFEDGFFLVGIHVDVLFYLAARPDKAHIADEDVQELWELVEFVAANEAADRSDTRIVFGRCGAAELFRVDHHGSKLEDAERLSVQTNAHAA